MDTKIRIDPHTLERAAERGASEDEICDVIENGVFYGKWEVANARGL